MKACSLTPPYRSQCVSPLSPAGVLIAAAMCLVFGCASPAERPRTPNVLIILVDTLRSDHLSAWDYPRETSPELERLAATGTRFTRFFSHSAVTRPSVATLFTSQYVSGHGIADQLGSALPPRLPVLAELFDPDIYTRMAFVTNPQIHPKLGFDRGFDNFVSLFPEQVDPKDLTPHDLVKVPAGAVLTAAGTSIGQAGDRPFFCYIHLLDPHGPYAPSSDDSHHFSDPGYMGRITGSVEDFAYIQTNGIRGGPDLAHFMDLYDAEVLSVDRAIGAFVRQLDREGLLENTHLFITSDHGEEFMEHGGTGHGIKLYRETVAVPMLWIGPGVPLGRVVDEFAGLVDITPTIAELLNGQDRFDSFQGRSLFPLLTDDGARSWRSEIFLEGPGTGSVALEGRRTPLLRRGLMTPHLAVLATGCPMGATGWEHLEIFGFVDDAFQQNALTINHRDLTTLEPDLLAAVAWYERRVAPAVESAGHGLSTQVELPEDVLEKLRRLGYID